MVGLQAGGGGSTGGGGCGAGGCHGWSSLLKVEGVSRTLSYYTYFAYHICCTTHKTDLK